jgi:hypothetical protein
MESLTDIAPPYQRQTFPSTSNHRNTSSTAAFFASMRSYLRPSTHRRTSSHTRSAGLRRVGRPPSPTAFAL